MKFIKLLVFSILLSVNISFAENDSNGFFSNKNLDNNSFFDRKENKETKDNKNFNKLSKNKVLSISAIFNGHNAKELTNNLNNFFDFSIKRKILPNNIFINLPPFKTGFEQVLNKFLLLGVDINYSVPKDLQRIKHSPSYIVFTSKGYFVLDGFKSLSRTITTSGIFIEPR